MSKRYIFAAAAAFLFFLVQRPAEAATPILSGSYIYNWVETCIASTTTPSVSISFTSGLLTFNPSKGQATIQAHHTEGEKTYTLSALTGTATYTNTSTEFSFNPGTSKAETYQVTYGALTSTGIATYFSYIGVVQAGQCSDEAWLSRT